MLRGERSGNVDRSEPQYQGTATELRPELTLRRPPVWLMGLSNATLGFNTGITLFVVPGLLASHHVPEPRIAIITAAAMSSNFWAVLFAPVLDVRFSRRFYATALAVATAALAVIALLNVQHFVLLGVALTFSTATAWLANNALGGWLSAVCPEAKKNILSAWFNIALISGTGVMSAVGGELVRRTPLQVAAVTLGGIILLPATMFLFIPESQAGHQLMHESLSRFVAEMFAMFRKRQVVIVLLLFLSPCGSFGIANLMGGLGGDFHASARLVSLAGGAGAIVAGLVGCLLVPLIAKRLPLIRLYLFTAIAGSLFMAILMILPHRAWTFGVALLGLFLFQAASYAIQVAIIFDVIGPDNPLAATTFSILTAATNIPVTYMMLADGKGYLLRGVEGTLAMDGGISLAVSLLLGFMLMRLHGNGSRAAAMQIAPIGIVAPEE